MSDPIEISGELIGWHDPDENRQWVRENKSRQLAGQAHHGGGSHPQICAGWQPACHRRLWAHPHSHGADL